MRLTDAKVGDVVAVTQYAYNGRSTITCATIVRTTDTRVVLDNGDSFMRSTGKKVGNTSTWRPICAELWTAETDERLRKAEAETLLRAKRKRLHDASWDKLNAVEIDVMIAALDQVLFARAKQKEAE